MTEHVLAMARPWERNLAAGALQQLARLDFGMLLNLQEAGEHAHCGPGVLDSSGFSYHPETVMRAGIGVFHMCWPDMRVPPLDTVMKIVQVMQHVCHAQRRRIAVHCHAGLGRTGLAIACYLVYAERYGPAEAVALTRRKRPGALQTAAQELYVHVFAKWLTHLDCVYALTPAPVGGQHERESVALWDAQLRMLPGTSPDKIAAFVPRPPCSLRALVVRQKQKLHGAAVHHYWNVPAVLVELLRELTRRIAALAEQVDAEDTAKRCRELEAILEVPRASGAPSLLVQWRLQHAHIGVKPDALARICRQERRRSKLVRMRQRIAQDDFSDCQSGPKRDVTQVGAGAMQQAQRGSACCRPCRRHLRAHTHPALRLAAWCPLRIRAPESACLQARNQMHLDWRRRQRASEQWTSTLSQWGRIPLIKAARALLRHQARTWKRCAVSQRIAVYKERQVHRSMCPWSA